MLQNRVITLQRAPLLAAAQVACDQAGASLNNEPTSASASAVTATHDGETGGSDGGEFNAVPSAVPDIAGGAGFEDWDDGGVDEAAFARAALEALVHALCRELGIDCKDAGPAIEVADRDFPDFWFAPNSIEQLGSKARIRLKNSGSARVASSASATAPAPEEILPVAAVSPRLPMEYSQSESSTAVNTPLKDQARAIPLVAEVEAVVAKLLDIEQNAAPPSLPEPAPCGPRTMTLLVVGIDNAGKTTLLNTLQGIGKAPKPTQGFEQVTMEMGKDKVVFYDVAGSEKLRGIWSNYFGDVHGVIYVVDSADQSRMAESARVFGELSAHKLLAGKPALVFGNKADAEGALSTEGALCQAMGLGNDALCCCCSLQTPSEGEIDVRIEPALEWLLENVKGRYTELQARVSVDLAAFKVEQERKQMEQKERVLKRVMEKAFPESGEPVECWDEADGLQALSEEMGLSSVDDLPALAKQAAAFCNYQRMVLQMIGAMNVPISKKKQPLSWESILEMLARIKQQVIDERLPAKAAEDAKTAAAAAEAAAAGTAAAAAEKLKAQGPADAEAKAAAQLAAGVQAAADAKASTEATMAGDVAVKTATSAEVAVNAEAAAPAPSADTARSVPEEEAAKLAASGTVPPLLADPSTIEVTFGEGALGLQLGHRVPGDGAMYVQFTADAGQAAALGVLGGDILLSVGGASVGSSTLPQTLEACAAALQLRPITVTFSRPTALEAALVREGALAAVVVEMREQIRLLMLATSSRALGKVCAARMSSIASTTAAAAPATAPDAAAPAASRPAPAADVVTPGAGPCNTDAEPGAANSAAGSNAPPALPDPEREREREMAAAIKLEAIWRGKTGRRRHRGFTRARELDCAIDFDESDEGTLAAQPATKKRGIFAIARLFGGKSGAPVHPSS